MVRGSRLATRFIFLLTPLFSLTVVATAVVVVVVTVVVVVATVRPASDAMQAHLLTCWLGGGGGGYGGGGGGYGGGGGGFGMLFRYTHCSVC